MSLPSAGNADGEAKGRPLLDISPLSGLLPPNGRAAVDITFCPGDERPYNFNLVCNIRKKPQVLNLNVKGEGYAVHSRLVVDGEAGEELDLKPLPAVNHVDFGTIYVNEIKKKDVTLVNMGRFNFDYLFGRNSNNPMLQLTGGPSGSTVRKGDRVKLSLDFRPVSPINLDGTEFRCTIAGKYDYVIRVSGRGIRPALHFSFDRYDFGPCFITPPGVPPVAEEVVLRVTNQDPSAHLSLDCTFAKTRALAVDCHPTVLEPGQAVDVPFTVVPREVMDYGFTVPFLVNGSSTINVGVIGAGVPARLELANSSQVQMNFGSVSEGDEQSKQVRVVNRSQRPLEFEMIDKQEMGMGRLEAVNVSVFPRGKVILGPRETGTIDLQFAPNKRMPAWSEDVVVSYAGVERKLLEVTGRSTGIELALETDTLPFGTVCMGSQQTRSVLLENSGDVTTSFRWQNSSFGPHFDITPLEGTIAPQAEVSFQVTFRPTAIDEDIRVDGIRLFLDGTNPLALTCVGACVPQPEDSINDLRFNGLARQSQAQSVTIKNPTAKPWFLKPVLEGDHWKCSDELQVPANGSADCEVTFFPLEMTNPPGGAAMDATVAAAEGEGDEGAGPAAPKELTGSLFFALPNGSAEMYTLKGTSGPPECEGTTEVSTPAKAILPVALPVKNWLPHAQRFQVKIELDADTPPASTEVDGTPTVDVGALGTVDYVVKFKAYKEGTAGARVTFTNVETGEYLFHDIKATVTEPGVIDTLALESSIRQVARRLITIDNPLPADMPLTFPDEWWTCDDPDVQLVQLGEMQGNTEGTFQVEYRPLVADATGAPPKETQLSFTIAELGTYKYALRLSALPPASEPMLRFEAPLGGHQTETFSFDVFNKAPLTLTSEVSNPLFFEVEKSMAVEAAEGWEGRPVRIQVKFEPEKLGTIDDVLVVNCGEAGEYRCKLVGLCRRPQPMGPLDVAKGGSRDLTIRNVYAEDQVFEFTVDNPAFTLGAASATIKTKESGSVTVKFDGAAAGAAAGPVTAKVFVSCPAKEGSPPWCFYLRGEN